MAIARPEADLLRGGANGEVRPSGWLGRFVRPFVVHPRWYVGHGGPLSPEAVQAWAAAHQIG